MKKLFRNESGQSLVMVALLLTVIMGCAAVGIDSGRVHFTQIDLQNAADIAALAGANKLPEQAEATKNATKFAKDNGAVEGGVVVSFPANNEVEVVCTKTVDYTFAKVIGFDSTEVVAKAKAKKNGAVWVGDALPFINLDNKYSTGAVITAWEPTGMGQFESIWKDDREYVGPDKKDFVAYENPHFNIFYQDGITVTNGEVANIKDEVGLIYDNCKENDYTVFVFSLKNDVIESGKYSGKGQNKMKNQDVIPLEDLVLLEVNFDYFEFLGGNSASLYLTVVNSYDITEGMMPQGSSYYKYGGTTTLIE